MMHSDNPIRDALRPIQLSEGDGFLFDEEAILEELTQRASNKASLTIKLLSIIGGLLATLAFMGFLAVAGLYDSEAGLLIFGSIFIVGAIWLNKVIDHVILDTSSIAVYVTGYVLLAIGLQQLNMNEYAIIMIFVLIALAALAISESYILVFISVLILNGSLLALIFVHDAYNFIHAFIALLTIALTYVYLNEARLISFSKKTASLYRPLCIGLIFSLISGLFIVGQKAIVPIPVDYIWLSSIAMSVAMLIVIAHILQAFPMVKSRFKIMIFTWSIAILLPLMFSPAISGAILIILLTYFVGHRTGFVVGIISFKYFLIQYYYDLDFTLLTKSGLLFSSGVLLITAYLIMNKQLSAHEKI